MKKNLTTALLIALIATAGARNEPNYPAHFKPGAKIGLSFTENKGQVHDQNYNPRPDVLFGGGDGRLTFHLKNNGISYQLNRVDRWKEVSDIRTKEKRKEIDVCTIYRLDVNWLNANANLQVVKGRAYEGFDNYYLESCPHGVLKVESFEDVTYQNIYGGIDLKWYQKDGHLKYDYIVAAGANYKNIQLKFSGATNLTLNQKGEVLISTPLGDVIEQAPIVIQNGNQLPSYWLINNNTLSFEIKNLNPKQAFVIDPGVRTWGTYYGGLGDDVAASCATDASGNVYLSGSTDGSTGSVIATTGAYQTTYGGGSADGFLIKFNSLGVRQWGTYYGGTGSEAGLSCVTDVSGDVYLSGYTSTNTSTVIATAGAHQTTYGGGSNDAFLVKFNSLGVRQWGTYYGGTGSEAGLSCVTDVSGDVYLSGYTDSSTGTVIATSFAHQTTYGGGSFDGFLVKFSSSGVRQWGTYYGGSGDEVGNSCTSDASGNVYLVGYTDSSTGTVIATTAAHQTTYGGVSDAYIVKFNSSGVRQWGSYYGGTGYELGNSCATDASGNIYLLGFTDGSTGTVIATAFAHQTVYGGGSYDGFLVKFDSFGVRQWGTYYGGAGNDVGNSCSTDASGNVFLTGYTSSATGTAIATAGAHQTTYGLGIVDGCLVKFNSSGVRQWGTYYGGTGDDYGLYCATDASGKVYLVGFTNTGTGSAISSVGAHQTTFGGFNDGFLVQFVDCSPTPNLLGFNQTLCSNSTATLTASSGSATINWYSSPTSTMSLGTGTTYVTSALSAGIYTYYAEAVGCVSSASRTAISLTVNALPTLNAVSSNSIVCIGETASLTASGAITYIWNTGATGSVIAISPSVSTTYTVNGTDANGCNNFAIVGITVNVLPIVNAVSNKSVICNGQTASLTAGGAASYIWNTGAIGSVIVVSPSINTTYTVNGTSVNGCNNLATVSLTVNALPTVNAISTKSIICRGQTSSLTASGAVTYIWNTGVTSSVIAISPSVTTTYTVNGTGINGCDNIATITQLVASCAGFVDLSGVESSLIHVYPNPSKEFINIEFENESVNPNYFTVTNTLGQVLLKETLSGQRSSFNISHFPGGLYILNVESNGRIKTVKLIKE